MRDLPEASRIFVSGTTQERKRLQNQFGLSDEDMARLGYYARLRASVLSDLKTDGDCSVELEPQVAQAVATMHEKGYETFSSGFASAGEVQHVSSRGRPFHAQIIPDSILDRLADFDLQFLITPDAITFQSAQLLSLDDLTFIWNRVADSLPPRTTA